MKLRQGKIFRRMCQKFCPWGGHVWQGVGACIGVVYMAGGMCGRRGMSGGGACVAGVCAWQGTCIAGKTAIAAGSAHPTGIHSCFNLTRQIEKEYQVKFYFLGHINSLLSKCCCLQWWIQDLSLRRVPTPKVAIILQFLMPKTARKWKNLDGNLEWGGGRDPWICQ